MDLDSPSRSVFALKVAVALASGASLALLVPPYSLYPLHWLIYLPMLWVLRAGDRPRTHAFLGWMYGTAAIASIFYWIAGTISLFSNIPAVGAYAILVGASLLGSAAYPILWASVHPLRRALGDGWILAVPAVQVVLEYISSYLFLFPYNHGVSQYKFLFTWQLASVTGIWGLTYLLFFFNCALGEAIYRHREGRPFPVRWVSAAVAALSLVVIFGKYRYEAVEAELRTAPEYRVAQIQTNLTLPQRFEAGPRAMFKWWVDQSRAIPRGSADMVVWAEGASPFDLSDPKVADYFSEIARDGNFEMLVGAGIRDRRPGTNELTGMHSFNSMYHVQRDGTVDPKRYDKMVPLPIGEYMPLSDTRFSFLVDWIQGPGDSIAGTEARIFEDGTYRFATPICYEAILSGVCRRWDRPDLFVTVTNDAWFSGAAPDQHAMLAAVRSIELGIPMFREGFSGISFVVEPHGVIHSETLPFTEVRRITHIRMHSFPTLYAKFGDWFVALCAAGLVAAGLASRRK